MQVPTILYGEAKVVRNRCRTVLRSWLKSGGSYIEAMEAGGMLDVADFDGPFHLDFSPREHGFGLFLAAPLFCLFGGNDKALLSNSRIWRLHHEWWRVPRCVQFFDESLTRPWAVVSVSHSQYAHGVFGAEDGEDLDRYRRYLAAILRDCDELEAVGPRYGDGRWRYLAQQAHKVYQSLRVLGLHSGNERLNTLLGPRPGDEYYLPEPEGGLRGVLSALGVSVDLSQTPERRPDHPAVLIPQAAPPPPPFEETEPEMSAAMQAATERDDTAIVWRLVDAGESPNAIHPEDPLFSLFFWAIRQGDSALVTRMLDKGAHVEDRDNEGASPLMIAAMTRHREIVQLLLERGARARYRTKGLSAIEYAEMGGDREIQEMINAAYKSKKRRGAPS